ncbi:hypothetical protein C8R43DRAFT_41586 [Mycena crocata]|nr:hypothetical protein C8R43DRAFT_41586 [Mycena crocata]
MGNRSCQCAQLARQAQMNQCYHFIVVYPRSDLCQLNDGARSAWNRHQVRNHKPCSGCVDIEHFFLITFGFAPLVLGPWSEIYGRRWPLHISNSFSAAFNFGCAFSPTTGSFLAFRDLAGISSSAPVATGGGNVADMFIPQDRAAAMGSTAWVRSLGLLSDR